MYKNLRAEMIRQDVSAKDISEILGIKFKTAQKKVNGQINFSLKDCKLIASLFKENNDINYLFEDR